MLHLNTLLSGAEDILATPPAPNDTPSFEVISVTNSDGETSRIALFTNESIDAYRGRIPEPRRMSQLLHGFNYDLESSIKKSLSSSFSPSAAEYVAYVAAIVYAPEMGYIPDSDYPLASEKTYLNKLLNSQNLFSPMTAPMDEYGQFYFQGHPAAYCGVFHLSETSTGKSWIESLLEIQNSDIPVFTAEEYGPEFNEFVKYHEIAHCMGGNERSADYVAAKILLANHPDPEKALRFLEIFEDIRALRSLSDAVPQYLGTSESVRKAMDEFNQIGGFKQTNEKIWSLAKTSKSRKTEAIESLAIILNGDPKTKKMLEDMDYNSLGRHILELRETANEKDKDLYGRLAVSMFSMARIVPKPETPKVTFALSP